MMNWPRTSAPKPWMRELFLGKRELTIQGNLVLTDGVRSGTITLSRGKGLITSISPAGEEEREPDIVLETGYLFPGFVDLHVHAREDPSREWTHKETFASAGRAAVAGGVTAFADMPNTPSPATDDESYARKLRLTRYALMDVLPYAGIGPGTVPLTTRVPYKVFMSRSVGDLCFTEERQLRETLHRYRGHQVSFHCEDPAVLEDHAGEREHRDRRPPEAEIRGVETALELIREYGLSGTLCHLSTKGALDLVRKARGSGGEDGIEVRVEATPHHLMLEDNGGGIEFPACLPRSMESSLGAEGGRSGGSGSHGDGSHARGSGRSISHGEGPDAPGSGRSGSGEREADHDTIPDTWFQVNPPIRGREDRRALLEAFAAGEIDFLATDHAPHTVEEKRGGMSGIPHLDSFGRWVGCLLELGVEPRIIGLAASHRPGAFLNAFLRSGRSEGGPAGTTRDREEPGSGCPVGAAQGFGATWGVLVPGAPASLTWLEPQPEPVVSGLGFTGAGWDPLGGRTAPWRVGFTILRGRGWRRAGPGKDDGGRL